MCQQTRQYSFNEKTKYFIRDWLCFVGLLFGNKMSSNVISLRQVRQSWITRPQLEKLPLAPALNAGLARVNFANFVILANASSNLHHQARRSKTYTLQVEKIHFRMNHLNHQSFPYSQSHPKFVLRFYPRQILRRISADIFAHIRIRVGLRLSPQNGLSSGCWLRRRLQMWRVRSRGELTRSSGWNKIWNEWRFSRHSMCDVV